MNLIGTVWHRDVVKTFANKQNNYILIGSEKETGRLVMLGAGGIWYLWIEFLVRVL